MALRRDARLYHRGKDSDFNDLSVPHGFPPKMIWLRIGNSTTASIETIVRNHIEDIEVLYRDPTAGFITLY
jgi:predicted nuclease of predicted toxin-antitoxin system